MISKMRLLFTVWRNLVAETNPGYDSCFCLHPLIVRCYGKNIHPGTRYSVYVSFLPATTLYDMILTNHSPFYFPTSSEGPTTTGGSDDPRLSKLLLALSNIA